MPIFLGVTAKKLVGDPFCRGGGRGGGVKLIQNFYKSEIYRLGENLIGKKFSLGRILSPGQYFVTFLGYNEINTLFNSPVNY